MVTELSCLSRVHDSDRSQIPPESMLESCVLAYKVTLLP